MCVSPLLRRPGLRACAGAGRITRGSAGASLVLCAALLGGCSADDADLVTAPSTGAGAAGGAAGTSTATAESSSAAGGDGGAAAETGGAGGCGGVACGDGACCSTSSSLLEAQLIALGDAATAVSDAASTGSLDATRSAFRDMWARAIALRYPLELAQPLLFAQLFEPVGAHAKPAGGIHAVETRLFGRGPKLAAAGAFAAAVAELAKAAAATHPELTELAVLEGFVAAYRLPVELVAGTETPGAGASVQAIEALLASTGDHLSLLPSFLSDSPELWTTISALGPLNTAIGMGDATALPSFMATSAKLVSQIAGAAKKQGISLSVVPGDDFSEAIVHRERYPENTGSLDAAVIELGRLLFFDPILSEFQDRSCASCHKPALAFTDGLRFGRAADGGDLPRNTPTILNASLQHGQFWDARAKTLAAQVIGPMSNPAEMGSSVGLVLDRLEQVPEYVSLFSASFSTGITVTNMATAIAAFEASALTLDSPADRFLAGDVAALDDQQRRGLLLFVRKARCANCHFLPITGGTQAPTFATTHTATLGVSSDAAGLVLDSDPGVAAVTVNAADDRAFKTPTLRNIGQTAPYMHNGVYATLEEVIDFYDGAGGPGFEFEIPNADPRLMSLMLTVSETDDLGAFLLTLTDDTTPRPQPPPAVPSGLQVGGGD